MVKKIISIILILLGLSVLGFGIGSGTIWKPETAVTLKTGELDKALLVATNPGVVNQVNSRFEMTVTAPDGGDVALVVGNTVDVAGWIGNDAHWLVTGATDWEKLNTEFVAEKADPDAKPEDTEKDPATDETPAVSPIADLAKSDMWYQVAEGKGTVTLTMEKVPDNVIFLAGSLDPEATDAPQISLTWERDVPTPLMLPGILAGALLLAVGILVLIDSLRHTPDWTEVEAQAILAGTRGSKKSDLELSSDVASPTPEADSAEVPSKVVAAWGGGAGSVDEASGVEPAVSGVNSGSDASSFAPKTSPEATDNDELDLAIGDGAGHGPAIEQDEAADSGSSVAEVADRVDDPNVTAVEAEGPDEAATDADDSDAEAFVFTPVTLDFTDQDDEALETDIESADASADSADSADNADGADGAADQVVTPDELLLPVEPVAAQDATEPKSWFGRVFGKKTKQPKTVRVVTPLEPLAPPDADSKFAVPTDKVGVTSDQDVAAPIEPDKETQAALEVFAAMDEPDVTTGALQAAGLTRRQLREMRERKEQDAQRNVPTTTGSLDFGGPSTPPVPAPERPSWLPEGSDSTSASSWRAAWGVRPEGSAAAALSVPAPPLSSSDSPEVSGSDTAATDTPSAESGIPDAAPLTSSNDGAESETDAPTQKATPRPTTRRALYSAYREAAERIANEDAEQEQTK